MPGPAKPTSYEEVSYPSYAYPQTYPDHLAVLATLSGMKPPPVHQCRVLELGCGQGGNLVPMAYNLPESQFVGFDLSSQAIAQGQTLISSLGLTNITLTQQDILTVSPDLGQFDYIIVYGIFSWVPEPVREKILTICRQQLAPNGVAYISYNALPGWHMYNIARDIMLYHTEDIDESQARIGGAREALAFLAETVSGQDNLYGQFLQKTNAFLSGMSDGYLYHDFMEETNAPLYFSQFMAQAEQHGLQYLANTEFVSPHTAPDHIVERLMAQTGSIIRTEQYLDFLTNRTFRETALCHADVALQRTLTPAALDGLQVASQVQPVNPDLNIHSDALEEFAGPEAATLSTTHPLTKAALIHLNCVWPQAAPFKALAGEAQGLLGDAAGHSPLSPEITRLATNLMLAYSRRMSLVNFHTHAPSLTLELSEYPIASAVARYQAEANLPVTNLYHHRVTMTQLSRHLLAYLDGSRSRSDLLDIMIQSATQGLLAVSQEGQPVEEPARQRSILAEELEHLLQQLMRAALLVG